MPVAKTYHRQTAKFLAVVGENMPDLHGDIMQKRIERPKALQIALRNALCFSTWMTIKLGTFTSAKELHDAITTAGFLINEWAADILASVPIAPVEREIELVHISIRDLGFEDVATREQIYSRGRQLGLELVPPEAAMQLRLQYKDQRIGEWFLIAMEAIPDSCRRPSSFFIACDEEGEWLNAGSGAPDCVFNSVNCVVFARRK
jgi:hypothetical protein